MKAFTRFLVSLVLSVLVAATQAQTTTTTPTTTTTTPTVSSTFPISYSAFYDFTTHKPIAAVTLPVYSIPNFLLQNLTFSVNAFAGASLSNGSLTGGTILEFSHPLNGLSTSFKGLNLSAGIGEGLFQGSSTHLIGFFGIKGTLGSL